MAGHVHIAEGSLEEARVLCVGAGGLGSPAALYLAAQGVGAHGALGIVDNDRVDVSNLQRQVLHGTSDIDRYKVDSAQETLYALNPEVTVTRHRVRLTHDNIHDVLDGYDIVLEGTDNTPSKFLIHDAAWDRGMPLIFGGIFRMEGQVMTILPGETACLRCLFPEPPSEGSVQTCDAAGVVGAVAGVIGTLMAMETVKLITGEGELLTNRLLTYDALRARFREVPLRLNDRCPLCGARGTGPAELRREEVSV